MNSSLLRSRRAPRGLALLTPATLLLLGCAGLTPPAAGAEQAQGGPRALVAHLQELERQERYGEVLERITPDQRETYIYISWFGAAYDAIGARPEVVDDYRAIVSAHGLDEAWLSEDATGQGGVRRVAARALRGVDLAPLLKDLATFRKAHGRFGTAFGFLGELGEVHVEQDRARARVGDTELELVRVDDAWTWRPFP